MMQEDNLLRISIFFATLVVMLCWEALSPRRKLTQRRRLRWKTNLGIAVVDTVALRLLGFVSLLSIAHYASTQQWGLLNVLNLPTAIELVLALILLDFFIYLQHWLTHKVPLLWRLHKVHHTDRDLDASSGIRFHPLEIIFSLIYKAGAILIIGPLPLAVLIFEIILNACSIFNHANVKIPRRADQLLRWVIITPDVHRVHHSIEQTETNSNYGNCLSIWDRLFGTYVSEPLAGHKNMTLGLAEWQNEAPAKLGWSLLLPFRR